MASFSGYTVPTACCCKYHLQKCKYHIFLQRIHIYCMGLGGWRPSTGLSIRSPLSLSSLTLENHLQNFLWWNVNWHNLTNFSSNTARSIHYSYCQEVHFNLITLCGWTELSSHCQRMEGKGNMKTRIKIQIHFICSNDSSYHTQLSKEIKRKVHHQQLLKHNAMYMYMNLLLNCTPKTY